MHKRTQIGGGSVLLLTMSDGQSPKQREPPGCIQPQTKGALELKPAAATSDIPHAAQAEPEAAAAAATADQPTHEEVVEYASYLGMDPVADAELLYIAEWALTAPLPDGWTEHR